MDDQELLDLWKWLVYRQGVDPSLERMQKLRRCAESSNTEILEKMERVKSKAASWGCYG